MYDLVIIGAGPAGIALAAEARAVGHKLEDVLILEKGAQHNWAIRQYYPAHKKTTANYKGHVAQCGPGRPGAGLSRRCTSRCSAAARPG